MIGFDCEWVSAGSNGSSSSVSSSSPSTSPPSHDPAPQPGQVSLLQISTSSGLCILVRLLKLVAVEDGEADTEEIGVEKRGLPETLRELLKDKSVLKLGVGLKEDSTRLLKDHGIEVKGCLDLRHLAVVKSAAARDLQEAEKSGSIGLNALVETVLRQTLAEKPSTYHKIRRSNWEADSLSEEQLQLAANKAFVALDIFRESTLSKMRGNR